MRVSRRYLAVVVVLAVLAVAFGVFGTVAPPLVKEGSPVQPQQGSSSESVGRFQNPPTYDSGWVDISTKAGQYATLNHGLNTTDVVVDITGKMSLDPMSGALAWRKTYGREEMDVGYSLIQASDDGYAIAGYTYHFWDYDFWVVKTDSSGVLQWNRTYGGTGHDYAYSLVQTSDGGYAIAGSTKSFGVGTPTFPNVYLVKTDASGAMLWNQTYGGTGHDYAYSVVQTSDGGYVLVGYTNSFGAGGYDVLAVKTDSVGNLMWNKTYGGTGNDVGYSVVQSSDGGYALTGFTNSFGAGSFDSWLIKTDASGNAQWNRTYGGTGDDGAYSLVQSSDGGYALAGDTDSFGAGSYDFWLVRTDASGVLRWNRTYGGTGSDSANSLVQSSDVEYALAGYTNSFGAGGNDFWLIETDASGIAQWNKTYGGTGDDSAHSLVKTSDGEYALAGETNPFGTLNSDFLLAKVVKVNSEHQRNLGRTSINAGWTRTYGKDWSLSYAYSLIKTSDGGYALAGYAYSEPNGFDFWLVKTDSSGVLQWNRTYDNGNYNDYAYSLVQTSDGGYVLAGYTKSIVTGKSDLWLVKTDALGYWLWDKDVGGTGNDYAHCVVQTSDGGYVLVGYTNSFGAGSNDVWLIKTDSIGNIFWNKTYGGTNVDAGYSLVQSSDGGYALTGFTNSFGAGSFDSWLIKTDASGNAQWNRTYGGTGDDGAYSLVQTSDGEYALAGDTNSFGAGGYDSWLIKTDTSGSAQWNKTYGGTGDDSASCVIQSSEGEYVLAGYTNSSGYGGFDSWLIITNASGNARWNKMYGRTGDDYAYSLVQSSDGGYALAGYTSSYGGFRLWLVKTDVEMGLAMTRLTNQSITLYRGKSDPYWNYVRVRIWIIKEPSWIHGDINMDGVVDSKDLYIIGRNYGKTFSLLSLSGIVGIAGIQIGKTKRKRSKQPSYIS